MEISPAYASSVVEDFFGWVEHFDESQQDGRTYSLLQDYITSWLTRDTGAEITGGDYGNYLLAVLVIIHEYIKDPSRLDYRPEGVIERKRCVSGLIDLEAGSAVYLDRHRYQQEVFHQLAGLPR